MDPSRDERGINKNNVMFPRYSQPHVEITGIQIPGVKQSDLVFDFALYHSSGEPAEIMKAFDTTPYNIVSSLKPHYRGIDSLEEIIWNRVVELYASGAHHPSSWKQTKRFDHTFDHLRVVKIIIIQEGN